MLARHLCQSAQCALAFGVDVPRDAQDALIVDVVLAAHHRHDDCVRVAEVVLLMTYSR